jgi:hypothetical protein
LVMKVEWEKEGQYSIRSVVWQNSRKEVSKKPQKLKPEYFKNHPTAMGNYITCLVWLTHTCERKMSPLLFDTTKSMAVSSPLPLSSSGGKMYIYMYTGRAIYISVSNCQVHCQVQLRRAEKSWPNIWYVQ